MQIQRDSISATNNLELLARQVVEGFLTGLHKSPYHGFSVEFAEHRLYNPGEPVKNIDWKLYARSNKLFIKKFEEETNLRSYILIDTSSSMSYPKNVRINKLHFSVYAASCLMYLLRKQRDGFGLVHFSDCIDFFTNSKSSKNHYTRLLSELDKLLVSKNLSSNRKTDFSKISSQLIEKIPQRSLVIIFSDMMSFDQQDPQDLFESLQYLKYKKHEVILFHVQDDATEKLFEFHNHPYNFIDLENKSEIKLNPINYRDDYISAYNEFQKKLNMKCNQYKIDYVSASIQEGFSKVLTSYLYKRSKLF